MIQANEDELNARHVHLQSMLKSGQELIDAGNLGSDKIKQRIDDINEDWNNLMQLSAARKNRLLEVVDYYQVRHVYLWGQFVKNIF